MGSLVCILVDCLKLATETRLPLIYAGYSLLRYILCELHMLLFCRSLASSAVSAAPLEAMRAGKVGRFKRFAQEDELTLLREDRGSKRVETKLPMLPLGVNPSPPMSPAHKSLIMSPAIGQF